MAAENKKQTQDTKPQPTSNKKVMSSAGCVSDGKKL